MAYKDKDQAVDDANYAVADAVEGLHPVDQANALRRIGNRIIEWAKERERENTENGVPEMPEDVADRETRESIERPGVEL